MAIKLIANYAKRLGLPGYSSHQFSVTCEAEVTDLAQVPAESSRLYGLLQNAVDREIQDTGFVPGEDYGDSSPSPSRLPAARNGGGATVANTQVQAQTQTQAPDTGTGPTGWRCSDRQRELLLKLAGELGLVMPDLDRRSADLFGRPARELDKHCASGLISDLLAEAGTRRVRNNGHAVAGHPAAGA